MGRSSVKSAERVLDVLVLLSAQAGPVPAGAIARRLEMPKSSVYHLLNVMRDRGFVIHYPEDRTWGLGAAAGEIGTGHERRQALERLARPLLRRLAENNRESALLAVLLGSDSLIVGRVDPDEPPLEGSPQVGERMSAGLGAMGHALLMHERLEQARRVVVPEPSSLSAISSHGRRTWPDLAEQLRVASARGFAMDDGAIRRGVACIASPVLDHLGYVVASVGVTFWPASRVPGTRHILAAEVRSIADELSRRLGFRADEAERPASVRP